MYICDICNREFKSRQGLNAHKGHHNPEFEEKFQKRMKEYNSSKERSELSKKIMNRNWESEEYKNKIKANTKDMWKSKKFTSEMRSKEMKNRWESQEYRQKMTNSMKKVATYTDKQWLEVLSNYNISEFTFDSAYNDGKNTWVRLIHKCGKIREVRSEQLSRYGTCTCLECNPMGSIAEQELRDYIGSLGIEVKKLNRSAENIYELDIYIPSLKIAFEYNGDYWHCLKNRPHNYHRDKTNYFLNKGIKVYHLWEHWGLDKCKSIIKSKLGFNEKIYARKCDLKELSIKEAKEFLIRNHTDGYAPCKISYGLFHNNKLISVFSIRGNIEIARYATESGYTVVGGFSKFMNRVREDFSGKLITYTDRDLCPLPEDSVYYKNGFKFCGNTGNILKYYNINNHSIYSRQDYQKCKLKNIFPYEYDDNLTEQKILEKVNIYALENSGNFRFEIYI